MPGLSFRPARAQIASGLLCLSIGLIGAPAQAALMKYSYSGTDFSTNTAPYTNFSNVAIPCDPTGAGPCAITNITAEIVIEDLGANKAFGTIAPVSWSISDGNATITSLDAGWNFPNPLQVSTDGAGVIDSWNFVVWSDTIGQVLTGELQQMRTRDFSGFVDDQTGYCQSNDGNDCTFSGLARVETFAPNHVGSWTVSPVPVPAAAWLFGSALGLLGWLRRRDV
ncbi:MAG: hypothetical protein ACR2QV_06570 [Gammaproteobacteria bacterium]